MTWKCPKCREEWLDDKPFCKYQDAILRERAFRDAALRYMIASDCFRGDIMAGKVTVDDLASMGIVATVRGGDIVFDNIPELPSG